MTEKTQATEQQPDASRLRDRTVKPEGTIPKQAQTYVIVGVSIVIVLAVLFSNKHAQPAAKSQRKEPTVVITEGNDKKISDFGQEMTDEQRAAQKAQLEKQMQAQARSLESASVMQPGDTRQVVGPPLQIFVPAERVKFGADSHTYALPKQAAAPFGPPAPGFALETPASIACLYDLVKPASGCNPNVVTASPSGGSKAIAIVDAYDYPTAMDDLNAFSTQFGLFTVDSSNFTVVFAGGRNGCSGSDPGNDPGWEVEQALDIEWAHARVPRSSWLKRNRIWSQI